MQKQLKGESVIRFERDSGENTNLEIILASASPRRKRLFKELGLNFKCLEAQILEEEIRAEEVSSLVQKLARLKAETVIEQLTSPALIVAADTLLEFEGKILGKPQDKNEATSMLTKLSGKTHSVYTGFYILNTTTREVWQGYDKTLVSFRNLSQEEIRKYTETEDVETMAGAYNLAPGTPGEKLIARIDGSVTNVIGLPMEKILPILEQNQIKIKK